MSFIGNLSTALPIAGAVGGGVLGTMFGGPAGGAGGAAVGYGAGSMTSNLFLARENFEYQKSLQNKIFAREDNAVQRRVADLKRAGLSPTLAAGSSAGAGQIVGRNVGKEPVDPSVVMALLKMQQDISTSRSQKDLIDQQYNNAVTQNAEQRWNLNYYKDKGLPTNASGFFKDLAQLLGVVGNESIKEPIRKMQEKITPEPIPKDKRVPEVNKRSSDHMYENNPYNYGW